MYKNRPIVVATLGYIIGIIWGLYLKINIVSFYILAFIFLIVAKTISNFRNKTKKFKFISISKIFRYIKLILDFKSLVIIIIVSSISNLIIISLNSKYENLYAGLEEVEAIARVVDNGTQKDYKTVYKIKIEKLNAKTKYKATFLYLDVNKGSKTNLKYGDYIKLTGTYNKPSKATNFGGFDYANYLKSKKIFGTIKLKQAEILKQNSNNFLFTISNNIFLKIKNSVQNELPEEQANLLLGVLLGYKEELPKELQENFRESNISHILAVSGLHVSYIIFVILNILQKLEGKRKANIHTLFFIILYMFITNFAPSVVRAGIMATIAIMASLTYNKNDIWTSIAISFLIILIYNPYLITSAGVLLSYGGTIGIILFQKNVSQMFQKIKFKGKPYKYNTNKPSVRAINYIKKTLSVTFAAQLVIAPIIVKMFNTASATFFITNFFVSILIGPIISIGFLFIILSILFFKKIFILKIIIKFALEKLLEFLIIISKLGKFLPFNQIYIATPKMYELIMYYIVIFIFNVFYKIKNQKNPTVFQKRLINSKNLIKHLIRKNRKKIIASISCTIILIFTINIWPADLKIHFIDVGQGDSTLIITPLHHTILIDGGGSKDYDVGKNTLIPYLLDRGITKLDYIMLSHADFDHMGGIINVIEKLQVKNIIVSKQPEKSDNFQELIKIVNRKNVNIIAVKKGDKINIEKNLYFKILWPDSNNFISENALNNNSIVCKLCYKSFSFLFTGDIEQIAENQIIKEYKNTKLLNSTVIKVAHHRFKNIIY